MPLLSTGEMILGGIAGGLTQGIDTYLKVKEYNEEKERKAKEFEDNKRLKNAELTLKAMEQGALVNPNTGEITKGGPSRKLEKESLDEHIKIYGMLTDDQKNSPEGEAIRNLILSKTSSMYGGGTPQAEQPNGLMELPSERDPNAGLMPKRTAFQPLPGQSKEEKTLREFSKKKQIEEAVPKTIPAGEVVKIGGAEASVKKLDDIRSIIDSNKKLFGPVAGRIGKVNPYATGAQTINTQIFATMQDIGTYLEGGKLSDRDFAAKYGKIIPNLSDTPEVAANKLDIVEKLVSDKQNAEVSALSQAGYKTKGIRTLKPGKLPAGLIGKSKPKTVEQGGFIYRLNEQNGEYE